MILNEALVIDSIPVLIFANISLYSTFLCQYIQSWPGSNVSGLVQPSSLLHFFLFEKQKKEQEKLDFQSRGLDFQSRGYGSRQSMF